MIVPDVNLLVYAHQLDSPWHDESRTWWEEIINDGRQVGVPWIVAAGFVRLATNPRVSSPPASVGDAVDRVAEWFKFPNVSPVNPGPDHLVHFKHLLEAAAAGGRLTTDAHIAAIAIEYQAEVHSNDRDFGRFPGLRWRNPIERRSRSG